MTPSGAPITPSAALAFFNYLESTPTTTAWFIEMNLYGGTNSAINKVSLEQSSFAWRDSLLTFQLYASSGNYLPPYPDEGFVFVRLSLSSSQSQKLIFLVADSRVTRYSHE